MPQWGVGKGLQTVINSWVNVNNSSNGNNSNINSSGNNIPSKEVAANELKPTKFHHQIPNSATATSAYATTANIHHQPFQQQQKYQQGERIVPGGGTEYNNMQIFSNIGTTANPSPFSFHGSKQVTQPKNNGKLRRTNSQSDLLKERAARKSGSVQKDPNTRRNSDFGGPLSFFGMASGQMSDRTFHGMTVVGRGAHQNHHQQHQGVVESAIHSDHASSRSQKIINTGQYINENAFANQHRSMQLAAQELENMAKMKKGVQLRSETSSAPPPSISTNDIGLSSIIEGVGRRQSLPENTKFPSVGPLGIEAGTEVGSSSVLLPESAIHNDGDTVSNCDKLSNSPVIFNNL
jgi:hypothetical protein